MLAYSGMLVSAACISVVLGFLVLAAKAAWIVGRLCAAFLVR